MLAVSAPCAVVMLWLQGAGGPGQLHGLADAPRPAGASGGPRQPAPRQGSGEQPGDTHTPTHHSLLLQWPCGGRGGPTHQAQSLASTQTFLSVSAHGLGGLLKCVRCRVCSAVCRALALSWLVLLLQVQSFKDDPLIFKGNLRAQTGNELLKVRQGTACVSVLQYLGWCPQTPFHCCLDAPVA